jgi:hypothetical protein
MTTRGRFLVKTVFFMRCHSGAKNKIRKQKTIFQEAFQLEVNCPQTLHNFPPHNANSKKAKIPA